MCCNLHIIYFVSFISNLKPHQVQNTISINDVRRNINLLTKPLTEIGENITRNIKLCENKLKEIQEFKGQLEELIPKLIIPIEDIEQTLLDHPRTVCGHRKCCEKVIVNGVTKTDYKQICHDNCGVKNMNVDVIGDKQIRYCRAFERGTKALCIYCGHSHLSHIHIRYETMVVNRELKDESVQQKITNNEEAKKAVEKFVEKLKLRIGEMVVERNTITECLVRFAHFLVENAITAFNDAYEQYLNYLINNGISNEADLKQMLAQYHEEKYAFEQILLNKDVDLSETLSPELINAKIRELCELKHSGPKIRHGLDIQQKSRQNDRQFREVKHQLWKAPMVYGKCIKDSANRLAKKFWKFNIE